MEPEARKSTQEGAAAKMKDIIRKIEALPEAERLTFSAEDLAQLIDKHAPEYPIKLNDNELFDLICGVFDYGVLRGRQYEAYRRRGTRE